MNGAVRGLAEIVLWARDLPQTMSFYRDLLGLSVISPDDLPVKFLSCGEGPGQIPQMIVLVPHPESEPAFPQEKPRRVLHHLAFNVEGARYEELRRNLAGAGFDLRDGVHPVLKDVRTFYVDDPEGNEVEIISPAP